MDGSVVYQQMDANSYSEDDVDAPAATAIVRFVDESRSDEWTQLALRSRATATQFTSATSYFTRRMAYFQDEH